MHHIINELTGEVLASIESESADEAYGKWEEKVGDTYRLENDCVILVLAHSTVVKLYKQFGEIPNAKQIPEKV